MLGVGLRRELVRGETMGVRERGEKKRETREVGEEEETKDFSDFVVNLLKCGTSL